MKPPARETNPATKAANIIGGFAYEARLHLDNAEAFVEAGDLESAAKVLARVETLTHAGAQYCRHELTKREAAAR